MTNHYKTTTIIFILIIAGAYAIAELDTNDLDDICNTNNRYIKRISGTWTCNEMHFGEIYYHSYSDAVTITMADADTYYTITNHSAGELNEITAVNNGLNITKNGSYSISVTLAMQGGNTGNYEIEVFKGADAQNKCATFQSTTTTAHENVVINCILELVAGDIITVRAKDIDTPAQDMLYHQFNLNIIEI